MPLIDDRGRLFGKVNLIDAVVALFVFLLIPLTYGAVVLFRLPTPTITSVQPAQVIERAEGVLRVTGSDLRPFLRARVGDLDAAFLLQSPTLAEVRLPILSAGSYDLVLYDQAQELVRERGAVTVLALGSADRKPEPEVEVQATGAFVAVSEPNAARIAVGTRLSTPGAVDAAGNLLRHAAEVLAVGASQPDVVNVRADARVVATWNNPGALRIAAILRLTCRITRGRCAIEGTFVEREATISLVLPPTRNSTAPVLVIFEVADVRRVDSPVSFDERVPAAR